MDFGKLASSGRQQGMSKWAWLLFIGMAALVVTSALRLGPHYVDFHIQQ